MSDLPHSKQLQILNTRAGLFGTGRKSKPKVWFLWKTISLSYNYHQELTCFSWYLHPFDIFLHFYCVVGYHSTLGPSRRHWWFLIQPTLCHWQNTGHPCHYDLSLEGCSNSVLALVLSVLNWKQYFIRLNWQHRWFNKVTYM